MANSNGSPVVRKPRPDFPLFPHATGRWAKKVRGKLVYFGKTADDPEGQRALNAWLDQRDDLLAGRTPRAKGDGLTMADLCNRFLSAKQQARDSKEITPRTWSDYKLTTDRLVGEFGENRLVSDLATDDFEALRANIAKTRAAVAIGNEIQRTRVVFKYAYDAGLIDQPMRYGPMFKRPSKKVLRIARAKAGPKLFEASDLRRLLDKAGLPLKAMMLLAINCGFGNGDCANLPMEAVDLARGWIDFPRPKTGIERRCPLWPETVAALKAAIAARKAPADDAHADLLFVTKYGDSFAKETSDNPISKEFAKLVKALGMTQAGRTFYALRHTFRTISDGTRDQVAANHIMGHADDSMAAIYRERIDDSRLQAVVDHVRAWLFPEPTKGKPTKPSQTAAKPTSKPPKGKAERKGDSGPVLLKMFA